MMGFGDSLNPLSNAPSPFWHLVIVVPLYSPLVVLEADVVKTRKGGTVDVGDLVIRNKKQLLGGGVNTVNYKSLGKSLGHSSKVRPTNQNMIGKSQLATDSRPLETTPLCLLKVYLFLLGSPQLSNSIPSISWKHYLIPSFQHRRSHQCWNSWSSSTLKISPSASCLPLPRHPTCGSRRGSVH